MNIIEFTKDFLDLIFKRIIPIDDYRIDYNSNINTGQLDQTITEIVYNQIDNKPMQINNVFAPNTFLMYTIIVMITGNDIDRIGRNFNNAYTNAIMEMSIRESKSFMIRTATPQLITRNSYGAKNSARFTMEIAGITQNIIDKNDYIVNKIIL